MKHLNTEIIFFLSKALHNPLGRELAVRYSPLSLSPPPSPLRTHEFQLLAVILLLGMMVGGTMMIQTFKIIAIKI